MDSVYIGIDPGSASGGFAIICNEGVLLYTVKSLTEREISDIFAQKTIRASEKCALIENVHSMPGQGVSSTFSFGKNYGFFIGLLIAYEIPFKYITPGSWMKTYGMKREKTESKSEFKKKLRAAAQRLYPSVSIRNETADALLIANLCKNAFNEL